MRSFTKDQNKRIKIARKEFLTARQKYKQTVKAIRKENKKGYVAPKPPTFWEKVKETNRRIVQGLRRLRDMQ